MTSVILCIPVPRGESAQLCAKPGQFVCNSEATHESAMGDISFAPVLHTTNGCLGHE